MKGFIPIALAAAELGISESQVVADAKRGILKPDNVLSPREVTEESVRRSLQSNHARWGEFARTLASADRWGQADPDRLGRFYAAGAVTFATERTGTDGGFLVPPDMRDTLLAPFADGQFNLPAMCSPLTTPTNSFFMPIDRRPFHDETAGVRAFLVGECEAIPQSKPQFEAAQAKMGKLAVLVAVSDELLEDAPSLGAYLMTTAQGALIYAATKAIIQGHLGLALGVVESPALITVAADAGPQTADTITATNVAAALSRIAAESLPTTVALAHPDAHEWLLKLAMSGAPVPNLYTPADAAAPAGRIAGRPLIVTEACSRLGDVGDLIFMDPKQYLVVTKDPQSRATTSMHMWFDQSITAFKIVMRFAGQPTWAAPVQSRDSSNYRSPYTAIAAR